MFMSWLILCLALILQCNTQTRCGNRICQPGLTCSNARTCVSPSLPNSIQLLSLFEELKDCREKGCPSGFVCYNKVCVLANSVIQGNVKRPTRPFRKGFLDRQACLYAQYYCDENIFHICENFPKFGDRGKGYAVIMSGLDSGFRLRQQLLGTDPYQNYKVDWNYHVIFIWKFGKQAKVFDFDSRLPWGVSFPEYFHRSMKTKPREPTTYFRIVTCEKYSEHYSSTRKLQPTGRGFKYGQFRSPPTPYLIKNKHGLNNTLPFFIDMRNRDPELGNVTNLSGIYKLFAA